MAPPLSMQHAESDQDRTRIPRPGEPVELKLVQQKPSEEESRAAAEERAREEEERVRKEAERKRTIVLHNEWLRTKERAETEQHLRETRVKIQNFGNQPAPPSEPAEIQRKKSPTMEIPAETVHALRTMYERDMRGSSTKEPELTPSEVDQNEQDITDDTLPSPKPSQRPTEQTVRALSSRATVALGAHKKTLRSAEAPGGHPPSAKEEAIQKVRTAFPKQAERLAAGSQPDSKKPDSEKPTSGVRVRSIQERRERDEEKLSLIVTAQQEMERKAREKAKAISGENPLAEINDEAIEALLPTEPPKKETNENAA